MKKIYLLLKERGLSIWHNNIKVGSCLRGDTIWMYCSVVRLYNF